MKYVLARLQYNLSLRREPFAQCQNLGTSNAVRLVIEIDQVRPMPAQRGDDRSRLVNK